ncbi:hypothetical protein [Haladaptatus sp. DYSN1]|uniref:hypothetical protein n=1 Tax=unclassified Haladaptatus TaxID=2622732 RepID=UPI002405DBDD|nr:hypothetical protein [Haladaptatus sp. DYSN1]
MYRYRPDEIDRERAHHQAVKQVGKKGKQAIDVKRIGNLGELAFEAFCREYLPVEMWHWENDEAMRLCNPESFSGHDFEVFGYTVDVKTSRDVSAFLPKTLYENDPDDDIIVMAWHRDNEDSLMLLGWVRTRTLQSKVEAEEAYEGDRPSKLDHLVVRPMNELMDLGPNTAHMTQRPSSPFVPGDRVVKVADTNPTVGVVIDVLPPEHEAKIMGQTMDGEAIQVTFPALLDEGPGDWRTIHPAKLASYCHDQHIKCYTYKHTNLEFAPNPYVVGDRVIKTSHDEPDVVIVVEPSEDGVAVAYERQFDGKSVAPGTLQSHCDEHNISLYSYSTADVAFTE